MNRHKNELHETTTEIMTRNSRPAPSNEASYTTYFTDAVVIDSLAVRILSLSLSLSLPAI